MPAPGFVPIAIVTGSVAPGTVLPPASATATTGPAAKAVPAVPPAGWVATTRRAGGPTAIAKGVEVAGARPEPVARTW